MTVIGDSVLTAVSWNAEPRAALEDGFDVDLDVAVCRSVGGQSCPFEGQRPPTVLDEIARLGSSLGPTVVVEAGYDDPVDTFPQSAEAAVSAMLADGVQRILWVTLREAQAQFATMNAALAAIAARHPQLTLVDWNAAAAGHPEWFQFDGVHLLDAGADAIAALVNAAVAAALAPPPPPPAPAAPPPVAVVPPRLPRLVRGRSCTVALTATGGTVPYRWATSAPLPHGLHLLADGTITGSPARAGRTRVVVRVEDAAGATSASTLLLDVRR